MNKKSKNITAHLFSKRKKKIKPTKQMLNSMQVASDIDLKWLNEKFGVYSDNPSDYKTY